MTTITIAIISMIAGAFISTLMSLIVPAWINQMKQRVPKRKRHILMMKTAMKYPFLVAPSFLIWLFIPFDRWFVMLMCINVLLLSYYIAQDMLLYMLGIAAIYTEKEDIENKISTLTDRLATCSKEESARIGSQLKELLIKRDSL